MSTLTNHTVALPESPPRRRSLLVLGFWLLLLALLLHQLLIILPAYRYGIVAAYVAGAHLKEQHFAVPGHTPYGIVSNLLLFLSLLVLGVVWWVAPVVSLLWGVRLWQAWSVLSPRMKWLWLGMLAPLWGLTLLTKTASYAFFIWLMD